MLRGQLEPPFPLQVVRRMDPDVRQVQSPVLPQQIQVGNGVRRHAHQLDGRQVRRQGVLGGQHHPHVHRRAAGGAEALHGHHGVHHHIIRITDFHQIHNPVIQTFSFSDVRGCLVDPVEPGLVLLVEAPLHIFYRQRHAGVHVGLHHRNGDHTIHLEGQSAHLQLLDHDAAGDLPLLHAAVVQVQALHAFLGAHVPDAGGLQGLHTVHAHDGAVSHIELLYMLVSEESDQTPDHLRMGAQAAGGGALEAGVHLQQDRQDGGVLVKDPLRGLIGHPGGLAALENIDIRHGPSPFRRYPCDSAHPPSPGHRRGGPWSQGSPPHGPRPSPQRPPGYSGTRCSAPAGTRHTRR